MRELERRRFEDEKRKAAVEALAAEKARLEQDKVDRSRWGWHPFSLPALPTRRSQLALSLCLPVSASV